MAYTPDPKKAERDSVLSAQCQELLMHYRPGSPSGPLVKALTSMTSLTAAEVQDILEDRGFATIVAETDQERRQIGMFHVACGLAERAVYGFTVQPY